MGKDLVGFWAPQDTLEKPKTPRTFSENGRPPQTDSERAIYVTGCRVLPPTLLFDSHIGTRDFGQTSRPLTQIAALPPTTPPLSTPRRVD